jgi:hypothetical protein
VVVALQRVLAAQRHAGRGGCLDDLLQQACTVRRANSSATTLLRKCKDVQLHALLMYALSTSNTGF